MFLVSVINYGMTKKEQANVNFELERWKLKGWEIFMELLSKHLEINADHYAEACRKVMMPPHFIGATSPILFHSAKSQGYVVKSKHFTLSKRSSRPLPTYLVVKKKSQPPSNI